MKDDWPGTGCFPGDTILPAVHHGAAEGGPAAKEQVLQQPHQQGAALSAGQHGGCENGQEGQEGGYTAGGEEDTKLSV